MSRRSGDNILTLLPKPPVLITESADEFDTLHKALEQDIKPRGVIEHLYVADISFIMWEILRLRRCKAVIINVALQPALKVLLTQFLRENDYADFVEQRRRYRAEMVHRPKDQKDTFRATRPISTRRIRHRSRSYQEVIRGPRTDRPDAGLVGVAAQQGTSLHRRISRQFGAASAGEHGPGH